MTNIELRQLEAYEAVLTERIRDYLESNCGEGPIPPSLYTERERVRALLETVRT